MSLIWTIIVGAFIGWLASLIVKGEGLGFFGDVVVGIVGAWLGQKLAGSIGIGATNTLGIFLINISGAVVLLILGTAIFGGKKRKG